MNLCMFMKQSDRTWEPTKCKWYDESEYDPFYIHWDEDSKYRRAANNFLCHYSKIKDETIAAVYNTGFKKQEEEIEMLTEDEFLEAYQDMVFNT